MAGAERVTARAQKCGLLTPPGATRTLVKGYAPARLEPRLARADPVKRFRIVSQKQRGPTDPRLLAFVYGGRLFMARDLAPLG